MIIIVNCQACGKQLFRDQDYEPKGHGVQLLVPPCDCAVQQGVQPTVLCTCETIDTEVTKLLDSACPVHGSHSG